MSRKIFKINNIEIVAGGALIYRYTRDGLEFLMIENNGKYEDIGGKSEMKDTDIIDTIIREVKEETNNLVNVSRDRFLENSKIINPNSKYCIYLIAANNIEKVLNTIDFSDIENHTRIYRKIKWISFKDYLRYLKERKLNYRLLTKTVAFKIEKIFKL